MEILTGCEVADAAVSSFPVVKHFNVFLDSESCAGSAGEAAAVIHFIFQGSEERFRDRVVPADPSLSHALRDINRSAVPRETSDLAYWLPQSWHDPLWWILCTGAGTGAAYVG